ncbi:MAG: hypothetical protein FWD48_10075 [Oscillospiraceae bacterium]|nr:hypothetical protein [Oscillospiraceae bacterium]
MFYKQKSSFEKFTLSSAFDMAKDEYKKATGKDMTIKGLIEDIDVIIEKIKAIVSLSKDAKDFIIDFYKGIKRGFMGTNFNPSDEDIKKAIEILKNIVTLACTSKEDIDKFNFWADLLTWFIDVRKNRRQVNIR